MIKKKKVEIDIPKLRLGLVCINTDLTDKKVYCNRTLTKKNYTPEKAKKTAEQNCEDLLEILKWNQKQKIPIKLFRISSSLFPRWSDKDSESYDLSKCFEILKEVGNYCVENGHRVLMHPDQFNQIGAEKDSVLEMTKVELSIHADILDAIGLDPLESVMIIHGGGVYKDKEKTIERWKKQFSTLPLKIRRRIALENDERQYGVLDILEICEFLKIPMIFDSFHHECFTKLIPEDRNSKIDLLEVFPRILKTWYDEKQFKQYRPICHVSNQGEGRIGHHSDYIDTFPKVYLKLLKSNETGLDIEVEAKKKQLAVINLYDSLKREGYESYIL